MGFSARSNENRLTDASVALYPPGCSKLLFPEAPHVPVCLSEGVKPLIGRISFVCVCVCVTAVVG